VSKTTYISREKMPSRLAETFRSFPKQSL